MNDPQLGEFPVLSGAEREAGGYYLLERHEREVGMGTLEAHSREVSTWYRLLTLQIEAFERGFQFDGPEEVLRAQGLRSQLLALGLTNSKAALDMLLVGYYSVAYAATRHMIESWCFSRYVEAMPPEASSFYAPGPRMERSPSPRKLRSVVANLKKRAANRWDRETLEAAYEAWERLCDGSHPSGVGIMQTRGDMPGHGRLGAVYHPELWDFGIRHGLYAAGLIVHETGRLNAQGNSWEREVMELTLGTIHRLSPDKLAETMRRRFGDPGAA